MDKRGSGWKSLTAPEIEHGCSADFVHRISTDELLKVLFRYSGRLAIEHVRVVGWGSLFASLGLVTKIEVCRSASCVTGRTDCAGGSP